MLLYIFTYSLNFREFITVCTFEYHLLCNFDPFLIFRFPFLIKLFNVVFYVFFDLLKH